MRAYLSLLMAKTTSLTAEQVKEYLKANPTLLDDFSTEVAEAKVSTLKADIEASILETKNKRKALKALCLANGLPYPFTKTRTKKA
jgi:hypothetical protein